MEFWDAYDSNCNKIEGITLVRGESIPDGVYHIVCEVLVKHSDGTYLLMQRDEKKHFGGMWEATAGGSLLKGESIAPGAIRELYEETGIVTCELTELGRVIHKGNRTIYVEFLCVTNQDKGSVVLQEGETQDYRWVGREDFVNISKQELVTNRMQVFMSELQR